MRILFPLAFITLIIPQVLISQTFTSTDYDKALWMTTRFYGAQRSGDNNWVLYNHLPSGVNAALRGKAFRADAHTDGTDLSGGWHDCGDHVKFGQTQFYSAYILLKGYAEFPTGYDDKYSYTYQGYKTAGQWNWEGNGHDPDCIPDILNEVKHATDFFIKCAPNATNFYYQVGNGGSGADHCEWATAVKIQTNANSCGGNNDNGTTATPLRPACKNPADASMASFCGATLALMARLYQPYDAAYAATCLTHAQYAYEYAKSHQGVAGTCFTGFYGANNYWQDDFATCCAELYWATNTTSYKTEAESYEGVVVPNQYWSFDYSNNGEIALYNLAQLGNASAKTKFNNRISGHYMSAASRNAGGVYDAYGGSWGALRYNAISSFLIGLYSKLNNDYTTTVKNYIFKDIDYIMGGNGNNRSYIVGFVPASGTYTAPTKPHHRSAYLRDDNPPDADNTLTLPAKNAQLGALVGGKRDGTYNDVRSDFANTEVCIDYNAALVGALGFIKSKLNPVTGGCQTCAYPNIGANQSVCGTSIYPLTLTDASTPGAIPSGVTYTWKRVSPALTNVGTAGATAKSRIIAASDCPSYPCKIAVVRDSTGGCSRTDTVTISNTLLAPALTAANLCSPALVSLAPSNLGQYPGGVSWQWAADYSGGTSFSDITSATSSTLSNVRKAGKYRLTATLGACTNSANTDVTSNMATPVDGCAPTSTAVNLSISNPGLNGTNYNWYSAASGGTLLASATTSYTTPVLSSTTTYYVQDMSSMSGSVGPTVAIGTGTNWGVNTGLHTAFTPNQNFTINSLQVPFNIYSNGSGQITVEILDGSGNAFTPAKTFVSDVTNVSTSQNGQLITFNFTNFNIVSSWAATLRMRLTSKGTINGDPLWSNGTASYPYNSNPSGSVTITGQAGGGSSNQYNYFYNWQISSGNSCDRLPVVASIGCVSTGFNDAELEKIQQVFLSPNPFAQEAILKINSNSSESVIMRVADLRGIIYQEQSITTNTEVHFGENLPRGVYVLQLQYGDQVQSHRFIKRD